jgi:hypothetical protein
VQKREIVDTHYTLRGFLGRFRMKNALSYFMEGEREQ